MADFDTTMDYLRRICSVREYCKKDLMAKAAKRLEAPSDIDRAIDLLQREGFLDEVRYSTAFARDRASIAGWGKVKIRFALLAKGIARETVDAALREIDAIDAEAKLRKLLENKCKILAADPQIRLKMLKFALSRGYGYEEANKVVSEILHGKNEDLQQIDGFPDCRT